MNNCPDCKGEMIYGGDQELENADDEAIIVSNHYCYGCDTEVTITRKLEE